MDSQTQNQNNLWIERKEYERLKSIEAHTEVKREINVSDYGIEDLDTLPKFTDSILTILTGIFAVISFVFPAAIIVFLSLGVISIFKLFIGGASGKTKIGIGLALGIGIVSFLLVLFYS